MSGLRSMTGFATIATGEADGLGLTLKSVNHRFLDLSLRLPAGCDALEEQLRRLLKEHIRRGHVELTVIAERPRDRGYGLNETVLSAYVEALRTVAKRLSLPGEPELAALARLPGVFTADGKASGPPDGFEERVLSVAEPLLSRFNTVREEEGAALAAALKTSLAGLRRFADEARQLRVSVRENHVARLRTRMEMLLRDTGGVSETRLLTEAALLAERSDVEEELLRLETHIESFATLVRAGGEVGKRLDFLAQEMNRAVNTLLSKTGSSAGHNGLRLTEIGLACKAEIERMREQVQNIE